MDSDPPFMKPKSDIQSGSVNWLPDLLLVIHLNENAPLDQLHERMDQLADASAPISRTWWNWKMRIESLSVAAPMLRLLRQP